MTSVDAPTGQPGGGKSTAARRFRRRDLNVDTISFLAVFLVVPVVVYIIFVVSPFIQAMYFSLTDWSGFTATMNFIGVDNYVKLFQDDTFMKAVSNSVTLAVVLPIVTLGIALVFATLVTVGGPSHGAIRGLRNSSLYRVISFFPYVIPAIVIGLIWQQVYDPNTGILNGLLRAVGLEQFTAFAWLGEIKTAMPAVMFVIVWGLIGFYMVLFIAAIKGVPAEIYEAARIDGAGRFRTAISVTIPIIRDTIQTSYIYMGILALDAFVYMAALESGGGPANSTLVISQQLFTTAFTKGQFGYASAMGVVLAIVTMLFALIVFTVNRLTGGKNEVSE